MRAVITILFLLFGTAMFARQSLDGLYKKTARQIVEGDYVGAAKTNKELLQLAEQEQNCHFHSIALYKSGELNDLLKNSGSALQYFQQGLKMALTCHDTEVIWLCTRYLGGLYFGRNNGDSAWHYLSYAYELIKNTAWYGRMASSTGMLGETQKEIFKDLDKAEYYLKMSLENAIRSNEYDAIGYAYLRWGCFWAARRHNCVYGLKFIDDAYALFRLHNDMEGICWTLKSIGIVNYQCHEYEKAHNAYTMLLKVQDSIFSKQVAEKTTSYRVLYETEKKEKESALKDILLEAEAKRREALIIIFGVIIILLSSVFYILYDRYTFKKKIETEKHAAEERRLRFKAVIDAEEKERERIARELHDGVGHLLSSARLNVSAIEDISEENKAIVDHAMNIIDEALRETRNISHNLMPAALSELGFAAAVKQLVRKIDRAGIIKVNLYNEEALPAPEQTKAVALYRILQELVNNALKYSGADTIDIDLERTGRTCKIYVTDNGKGFDTSDIRNKVGIGWENIYSRIEILNGGIVINSWPGQGTKVSISFTDD